MRGYKLRFKVRPEDFIVEERIRLPLSKRGAYAIYRVRKRGVTTFDVQARLATLLGIPPSEVVFPSLKDKVAVAVQHLSVKSEGPRRLVGTGFIAELVGRCTRHLRPSDLEGNRFTVVLRDLAPQEILYIEGRLAQIERFGFPNYFDEQRFGSRTSDGDFIGKRILRRDAEGALHSYLAEPLLGDPPNILYFKRFASENWGEWEELFERAPKPSNFRSVLTFLKDHPKDYRRALNLIPQRLLSLFLAAYQSFLWNRIAGLYLQGKLRAAGQPLAALEVAGTNLPLYKELSEELLQTLSRKSIPLPNLRASYEDLDVVEAVLREEGLSQSDLKARILKKAYLPKGERALLAFPEEVAVVEADEDEIFPGRRKLTIAFSLPPGSYATLMLKSLRLKRLVQ
jgi:tRNA pseudouridine13 synthase